MLCWLWFVFGALHTKETIRREGQFRTKALDWLLGRISKVLKIRIWGHSSFAGIACKIYFLMPSNFDEKNALWLWFSLPSENDGIYDICIRVIPSAESFHCIFETKFFPLEFEGISYNIVPSSRYNALFGTRARKDGKTIDRNFAKPQSSPRTYWIFRKTLGFSSVFWNVTILFLFLCCFKYILCVLNFHKITLLFNYFIKWILISNSYKIMGILWELTFYNSLNF